MIPVVSLPHESVIVFVSNPLPIAARTGGKVLTNASDILGPRIASATDVQEYWWILVALALALFLADVAIRLSDWDILEDDAMAQSSDLSARAERAG